MSRLVPAIAVAALLASSAAIAQTTTPRDVAPNPTSPGAQAPSVTPATPSTSATPSTTTTPSAAPNMTEAEAKQWVDKAVYSADDKNVGSVASIQRDASGKVTEVHADVGGFLGLGTTRVRLMPSQFKLTDDRVIVNMPGDQIKTLPHVTK